MSVQDDPHPDPAGSRRINRGGDPSGSGPTRARTNGPPPSRTGAYALAGVLLAAPFVALLWVTSYARDEPRLFGFPFFYWYQLLWVFIAAALTVVALQIVQRVAPPREQLTDRSEDHPSRDDRSQR